MVAARVSEASTPSVPLASSANAATRPGSDTLTPSTSVCGPVATNGTSSANTTNGTSMTIRLSRYDRRHPGHRDDDQQDREVGRVGGVPLARRRHHDQHEADQREDLEVRRRPVHRAVAVVVQPVAVTGAHRSVLGRRLRAARAAAA